MAVLLMALKIVPSDKLILKAALKKSLIQSAILALNKKKYDKIIFG